MTDEELDEQIEIAETLAEVAQNKAMHLVELRRSIQAKRVIRTHGITFDKVQRSDNDNTGGVYMHHLPMFVAWIEKQPDPKPFCEWNGTVYDTEKLISRMEMGDGLCHLKDVPREV